MKFERELRSRVSAADLKFTSHSTTSKSQSRRLTLGISAAVPYDSTGRRRLQARLDSGPHTDLPDLSVPEAIDRVIVYHAHRLHEGVADRRSDELEASTEEIAAEGI